MTGAAGWPVDLAARRLGGLVLAASDEFFAPKEALLRAHEPAFDATAYTDRGKLMDGWESRRRHTGPAGRGDTDAYDWAIVRLGVPGVVDEVEVSTRHFDGNQPATVAVDAWLADGDGPPEDDGWLPIVARAPVGPDAEHRLPTAGRVLASHLRLRIYPDGGVARLRAHGEPRPDPRALVSAAGQLDVAATLHGGQVLACSDAHFSTAANLIAPGDARDMGDGWETRRRRDAPGDDDWCVVRLAGEADVERVEVDTTHFVGNHPAAVTVELARAEPDADVDALTGRWMPVVAGAAVGPHGRHRFLSEAPGPATHLRLRIAPDGGVARLRAIGALTEAGWQTARLAWLDALPAAAARRELAACNAASAWVEAMVAARPFGSVAALVDAAETAWARCGPDDWAEAMAAHPRIGERTASSWSRGEQAAAATGDVDVQARLAEANRRYEARFGHVFLIHATGRSAEEILAALDQRMGNDPGTERRVAADELAAITRTRLHKLLGPR